MFIGASEEVGHTEDQGMKAEENELIVSLGS